MEWISVKDKLPEFSENVLIAIDTDYVILMGQLKSNGWIIYYADGRKFSGPDIITHWQPLPEPPSK